MNRCMLVALLATSFQCGAIHAAQISEFLDVSRPGLPGRLFVPDGAADSDPLPIILFMHGAGEQGNDNTQQIGRNIDELLALAKDRRAYIYAPQSDSEGQGIHNWNDITRTTAVKDTLDSILASENIDPTRIYLTGISMGGGGAWNMSDRYPGFFAAVAPMAGVQPDSGFDPAHILDSPTWAFHARDDELISHTISRTVTNGVLRVAGEPELTYPANDDTTTTFDYRNDAIGFRYTEYPTGGHRIWREVYPIEEFGDWMFAQAVPEPTTAWWVLVLMLAFTSRRAVRRTR
ncbi:MAG: dienelactone hydrolase family protein [Planctomycetales bacterium]|nr:dienelactone hydrolase family protein [Planctomycetales bacterium]